MSASLNDPAPHATAITPNDSASLSKTAARLLLANFGAGAAAIRVTTAGGEDVTIALGTPGVAGLLMMLPIQVTKVWATGTANITTILALSH